MPELTDLSVIRALCEKYDFALSKGFGQNFIINPGIPTKIVCTDIDQILRLIIGCQYIFQLVGCLFVFPGGDLAHASGNALQNIDSRVMVLMSQLSVQHNMTVQNASGGICNGLVKIIAVYQNCIQSGNRAYCGSSGSL